MSIGLSHGFEVVDKKIQKDQYTDFSLNSSNKTDNYTIDYTNITQENITDYKFTYKFDNITLNAQTIKKIDRINSNKSISLDQRGGQYPYRTDVNLTCENGNSYHDTNIDFTNGTYQNTTYKDGELQLTSDNTTGWYESPWINFTQKRSIDTYFISGNYSRIEYKTDSANTYTVVEEDNKLKNIPSGTVSDSFRYKLTLDENASETIDDYVYLIQDDTTLLKINRDTGNQKDSNIGDPGIVKDIQVEKDFVYIADGDGFLAINKSDMSQEWRTSTSNGVDNVAYHNGYTYGSSNVADQMYKLNSTGAIVETKNNSDYFDDNERMMEVNDAGIFTANNQTNYIYKFNTYDLSLNTKYYHSDLGDIDVRENYVYTASGKKVYKINMAANTEIWEKDFSTSPDVGYFYEINYIPDRNGNYSVAVAGKQNNIQLIKEDGSDHITRYDKNKNFYIQGDELYYAIGQDERGRGGYYSDNISNSINRFYVNKTLRDLTLIDSYIDFSSDPQGVSSFNIGYKNSINIKLLIYDKDNNLYNINDKLIEEFDTYTTSINIQSAKLVIDGDRWDPLTEVEYDFDQNYNEIDKNSADIKFSFNVTNSTKKYKYNKEVTNVSGQTFQITDTTKLNNSFTRLKDDNTSLDVNMTLTISYNTYKTADSSIYVNMFTSFGFMSILFLILMTGIGAYYSDTAGMPVMIFTFGLFPLAWAGFVSWIVTGVTTLLFLGFYIMYSRKRQNQV